VDGVHPWNFFPRPWLSIMDYTPSLEFHHNWNYTVMSEYYCQRRHTVQSLYINTTHLHISETQKDSKTELQFTSSINVPEFLFAVPGESTGLFPDSFG
jgi:hypothetical protein